jgi:hypothetical protein
MPHRTWLTGALMVMLFAARTTAAQEHHERGLPPPEIRALFEDGAMTIPFDLVNNHIIIPVSVEGTRFDVILDTGMPASGLMLYGTDAVDDLGLEYGPMKVRIGGAGNEGAPLEARLAIGVTVDVASVRMTNATVLVPPPLPHFTPYHAGVIGASLFDNFVVHIDHDNRRIHLYDPETYEPPEDAIAVPLTFTHHFPYAQVVVTMGDGRKIPLMVVVDLGASHAISLNTDSSEAISVPDAAVRAVIGRGVGGQVRGRVSRIRGVDLAGLSLSNVVATFPVRDHQHPGGMDSKGGNLGGDVLRRFNVTFDYAHSRMLLTPNRQFETPFEWDMSGMRLGPGKDAAVRIESIIAGSPAEKAGLAVDDVVTHVDGRAVSAEDIPDLLQRMKQEGSVLAITASSDGKPVEVRLELRRIV